MPDAISKEPSRPGEGESTPGGASTDRRANSLRRQPAARNVAEPSRPGEGESRRAKHGEAWRSDPYDRRREHRCRQHPASLKSDSVEGAAEATNTQ